MEEERKRYESEEVFEEYFIALEKANKAIARPDIPQPALMVEFMQLKEMFERLLKTAVRISKMGDKAQQKLMKYKEILDMMRNI